MATPDDVSSAQKLLDILRESEEIESRNAERRVKSILDQIKYIEDLKVSKRLNEDNALAASSERSLLVIN